ncbi:MAG: peptidoglycan editing factor PgeF [Desulfuromonadales bacterium]|nr:peptidoglycan editing factor PgeF [Desulfuromonadales bacterium]
MNTTRQGKISYLQPDWAADFPVVAGFTTRHGGVSRAPFNSLNLGTNTADLEAHAEANRAAMARAFDLPPHLLLTVRQVHGTGILAVNEPNFDLSHFLRVESDAIITNQSGIMAGVLVADCFPVVLYDPDGPAAGVVHAGWKGAAAGLIGQTVQAMQDLFGSRPDRLRAAIGPGIGAHSYEVDRPVRDAFREGSGQWERIASETRLGHWQLDLRLSCLLQLEKAGIARNSVDIVDECTCCHKEKFFSHRRDNGRTGRQMGFVLLP